MNTILHKLTSKHPQRITCKVPERIHREVRCMALHTQTSVTELMIKALDNYYEKLNIKCDQSCCINIGIQGIRERASQ